MRTLQRLFTNGQSKAARADEVEAALNEVMRQAEELRCLLEHHGETKND